MLTDLRHDALDVLLCRLDVGAHGARAVANKAEVQLRIAAQALLGLDEDPVSVPLASLRHGVLVGGGRALGRERCESK